ncbi:MAG: ACP S-malonyltransferase [Ignavibacteriota bacterium]|jgi:[acyl-carrier-protein] S-malonyltransferase|nr:ACP S-malonyltransferase [Ignavibacteriales bacterium]MBL1121364.1 [acyl-carrier-protein] S-malonyltransferase [Ignavibacteriota bacterium]MCC7093158.1 ACP S-malonyltransferase [Ignavibacteriaceae bacterium]MCE7855198.1 [acyl-carrier-protein] S-malonyltransferase [Ignavibacteria bacterium CHB3]MEB2297493.1 ACP S-malonyltransferase [Ignavibacteria bacterium]
MSKKAFIFPGQGSQYVGMAKDLFEKSVEAKEMIKTADDILGINLSYIMFNGPEDELKQTQFTQPAIFLHSVILAGIIRTIDADAAAGHSLGEYSAYVASGTIQFHEAIKLVRARGVAMQEAGNENKGTMAAVIGLDSGKVESLCNDASSEGIVQCANFNSPGQIVISGSVDGVKKAMELCKTAGAKMVKELVVSAAFHSPLMLSAKEKLNSALSSTNFYNPKFPVFTNVTAKQVEGISEIKSKLYEQITAPVRWEETIMNMIKDGVEEFYEIGPGNVLQGLVKRINPDVKRFGIDKFEDVEKYL